MKQMQLVEVALKPKDALGFLIGYVAHTREAFSPEDVVSAAAVAGIGFDDQRAWGAVFSAAQREGYIKRAGMFSRVTSNHSVRPGWIRA